jgi:MFS family permease
MKKSLPQTVFFLGLVSFLTDFSSEMIYPLLPVFLTVQLGASAAILGVIEGIAESTSAILKLFSGKWSDKTQKNKPFILFGYGLSGLVRPFIGLATSWSFVLFIRFSDRIGKGFRSSPRDALITEATSVEQRGEAFGFHRSMDHAGAVIGPLVASGLLFLGLSYKITFLMAGIPALLAFLVIVLFIKEGMKKVAPVKKELNLTFKLLSPNFKHLLFGILIFTLGNSTDAFILLKLNQVGVEASWLAILWSIHHMVKMLSSYYGGRFSDRYGSKKLIITGWIIYALIYLGFSLADSKMLMIILFFTYGIYYGLVEPAEKSFVSKFAPTDKRGTYFGFYHLTVGISALPASLLFGLIWQQFGPTVAFQFSAFLAFVACFIIYFVKEEVSA